MADVNPDVYEVLLEPDEGGFLVTCPALPGCVSFGATREEALENIREAIAGWLESNESTGVHPLERERVSVAAKPSAHPSAS